MAFSDTFEELRSIDSEDFRRIGTAPVILRAALALLACAAVLGGVTHFLIMPQFDRLKVVTAKEAQLRTSFDIVQAKAANREAYIEQLAEMKKTFNVMLRQLPNQTDIESLLVDLSQTSVASGLEVEYFKPDSEVPREFYAEYPIKISVSGQYHQFGSFVSGLAALPRIVTLNDISIAEAPAARTDSNANQSPERKLRMDLVATTYRYLEEDE